MRKTEQETTPHSVTFCCGQGVYEALLVQAQVAQTTVENLCASWVGERLSRDPNAPQHVPPPAALPKKPSKKTLKAAVSASDIHGAQPGYVSGYRCNLGGTVACYRRAQAHVFIRTPLKTAFLVVYWPHVADQDPTILGFDTAEAALHCAQVTALAQDISQSGGFGLVG